MRARGVGERLREIKRRISERHLGRHGIHGVGIRESQKALCLYVDPGTGLKGTAALRKIQSEIAPFRVVVVEEEPPTIRLPRSKRMREKVQAGD